MSDNDRIDAIRKRRDRIVDSGPLAFDLPESRTLLSHTVADIDYLLVELAGSKENADHLRKSCEMLSESVAKLTDEVERLRVENLGLLGYAADLTEQMFGPDEGDDA